MNVFFESLFILLKGLGFLLVFPDLRSGKLRVYGFEFCLFLIEVKDNL